MRKRIAVALLLTVGALYERPGRSQSAPTVRIGLTQNASAVSVRSTQPFTVQKYQTRTAKFTIVVALAPATANRVLTRSDLQYRAIVEIDGDRIVLVPRNEKIRIDTVGNTGIEVDNRSYRGSIEVFGNSRNTFTVVNELPLEDYLLGVVPNELSPTTFGELEALKAQAVAARTYALRNMGQFAAKGYDICATPACQVYRGKSTENPLSDQAVQETRGTTAAYRGQLINALYTSTCGGHTEDGGNIFDGEEMPYLRGVVCAPEQVAWSTIRTTSPPVSLGEEPGLAREAALLVSLDVLPAPLYSTSALHANASEEEAREWVSRLVAAMHRKGCEVSGGEGSLARRGPFMRHVVGALCWDERAQRLLAPGDPDYLLKLEDRGDLGVEEERMAAALLISEGILSPLPDNTLRP